MLLAQTLTVFKLEPTTLNMSQHYHNRVAKRTQHGPNNIAICCVGMLRSGRKALFKRAFLHFPIFLIFISNVSPCAGFNFVDTKKQRKMTRR